MPNTKSAFKRMRSNEKKRLHNISIKSSVKTAVKKVLAAVAGKNVESVKSLLTSAFSKLDKAGKSGVIHPNNINRHKSRLASKVNSILNK